MKKKHVIGAALLLTVAACSSDKIVLEESLSPNQAPSEMKMVIEDGRWVQKYEVCVQTITVSNNTKYRLKTLATNAALFWDIGAGQSENQTSELTKDPSCSELKARKIEITKCSIDGLPEGECIDLVKIRNN